MSPEIHCHLHCFEHVQLHVVLTAPEHQPLNLPPIRGLLAILDETNDCGLICQLQGFNSWVRGGAVIGVKGEEQWGEDTYLGSPCADCLCVRSDFPQPHLLFPASHGAGDPLTDGGGYSELGV